MLLLLDSTGRNRAVRPSHADSVPSGAGKHLIDTCLGQVHSRVCEWTIENCVAADGTPGIPPQACPSQSSTAAAAGSHTHVTRRASRETLTASGLNSPASPSSAGQPLGVAAHTMVAARTRAAVAVCTILALLAAAPVAGARARAKLQRCALLSAAASRVPANRRAGVETHHPPSLTPPHFARPLLQRQPHTAVESRRRRGQPPRGREQPPARRQQPRTAARQQPWRARPAATQPPRSRPQLGGQQRAPRRSVPGAAVQHLRPDCQRGHARPAGACAVTHTLSAVSSTVLACKGRA